MVTAAIAARTHDVGLISKVQCAQDWTFGQTGNWLEFKVDSDGDTNRGGGSIPHLWVDSLGFPARREDGSPVYASS